MAKSTRSSGYCDEEEDYGGRELPDGRPYPRRRPIGKGEEPVQGRNEGDDTGLQDIREDDNMDNKNDGKNAQVAVDTPAKKRATAEDVLRRVNERIPEPSAIRKWYVNYLTSDFTFASVSVAILLTIKVAFNLEWERFFNGLLLFYIVLIAIMLSRILKTSTDYYNNKQNNLFSIYKI